MDRAGLAFCYFVRSGGALCLPGNPPAGDLLWPLRKFPGGAAHGAARGRAFPCGTARSGLGILVESREGPVGYFYRCAAGRVGRFCNRFDSHPNHTPQGGHGAGHGAGFLLWAGTLPDVDVPAPADRQQERHRDLPVRSGRGSGSWRHPSDGSGDSGGGGSSGVGLQGVPAGEF